MKLTTADKFLFGVVLLLEVLHVGWLISSHRMLIGHDGFQYFSLQYFFLNDSAINHEIPLWIPYVSQGEPAGWWYTIQGTIGILGSALFLAGGALPKINFLTIFHGGILVDRLLLLVGVWLLGTYYFESALTRFFVAVCVMGATVTMTQFKFTLMLFYALPLMLYFGHAFLERSQWRYFFLFFNLFALQTFGNDAYFLPVITMTLFLYFFFCFLNDPREWMQCFKKLRWDFKAFAAIAGAVISLAIVGILFMKVKDNYLVNLNIGRGAEGGVPLNIFLTYAGNMGFDKWKELFFRFSPVLDYTVYFGFLALPLVLYGCFSHRRYKNPVLLLTLVLLFFSMGTMVSVFFYYVWPMMKFYRHLALIAPMIKLFMIFLAGFGFELVMVHRYKFGCRMVGVLFILWAVVLIYLSSQPIVAKTIVSTFTSPLLRKIMWIYQDNIIPSRFFIAGIFSMIAGFLYLYWPQVGTERKTRYFLAVFLLINLVDMGQYYCTQLADRTFVPNKDKYKVMAFSNLSYSARRTTSLAQNPRAIILESPLGENNQYVTLNAFLFQDALATPYRTDYRPRPLQDLIMTIKAPVLSNQTFLKIAGSREDKIQFFAHAYAMKKDQWGSYLNAPDYKGDALFLDDDRGEIPGVLATDLNHHDRIQVPYTVESFTANSITVDVNAPSELWMMYADNWHPSWKVEINGKPDHIYKADIAYKAVKLLPGSNKVRFYFFSPKITLLIQLISLISLGWLLILLFFVSRILRSSLRLA